MNYNYDTLYSMNISALRSTADELGVDLSGKRLKNEIISEIVKFMAAKEKVEHEVKQTARPADAMEVTGILDIMGDGYGFLRFNNYQQGPNDVYVPQVQIKRFNLKRGDEVTGDVLSFEDVRQPSLIYVKKINGLSIEDSLKRRSFERLLPIYPRERIQLGFDGDDTPSLKLIDMFSPIGKGQRGIIVAPPKAGKTTLIKEIASSITTHHPEISLIILLIDERPEEVTDIQRNIPNADVAYSTFDQGAANHCRVAEMVLERAKRLVEAKNDVVILLDSITRLTRAYNLNNEFSGRVMSGGIDPNAFFFPKKFFGSARNIEGGGSLTVLATALVETGSRMDDVIFEEFKGTGNMELKLDRSLQEHRIFPAIDIAKSGTRREEYLLSNVELAASYKIHEMLPSGRIDFRVYKSLLEFFKQTNYTSAEIAETIVRNTFSA